MRRKYWRTLLRIALLKVLIVKAGLLPELHRGSDLSASH
jgi:hypothetical protein